MILNEHLSFYIHFSVLVACVPLCLCVSVLLLSFIFLFFFNLFFIKSNINLKATHFTWKQETFKSIFRNMYKTSYLALKPIECLTVVSRALHHPLYHLRRERLLSSSLLSLCSLRRTFSDIISH